MSDQRPMLSEPDDFCSALPGRRSIADPGPTPDLTVVIPTRNESENVRGLVASLDRALREVWAEIVFVDDSDDRTPETIAAVAAGAPERIRLLHRPAGSRSGGLGGAVLAGIRCARGSWVVVMDGDLQHPPETVPAILRAAADGPADVVVASRYRSQGAAAGLDGKARRLVSGASTLVTRLAFPWRLRQVSDPMSGFFAVRREVLEEVDLRPNGYKILLEILVRAGIQRVVEVPYTFQPRSAGESKASLREGLRFLRHLAGLRLRRVGRPGSASARPVRLAPAGAASGTSGPLAMRKFGVGRALRGVRRVPHVRLALAVLLTVVAVPTTAAMAWNDLWTRGAKVPLLIPLAAAAALLVGRLRPSAGEPDVHDRQVDVLIAAVLLVCAGALTAIAQDRRPASSAFLLLATIAYLAAATTLLLGTRTAARLRWALILPLLAADGVVPSGLQGAVGRIVRGGAALVTQPHDLGLDTTSLTLWHDGRLLALPGSAVPGAALAGALACVFLAGLSCFGLTARLLIRVAWASMVLTAVAIFSVVGAMVAGRLFGPEILRVALLPAIADLALAATVAVTAWHWSRGVFVPRALPRHHLPRGRLAVVVLALAAVALGLRVSPELSMVRPHVPFVALVDDDGSIHLVSTGARR